MNDSASLNFSGDCMYLGGVVDFASVVAIKHEGDTWLGGQAPRACRLDMSGVTRSNSAGTALLLAWMRSASAAGKRLSVENPPASLVAFLQLAGLHHLLSKSDEALPSRSPPE